MVDEGTSHQSNDSEESLQQSLDSFELWVKGVTASCGQQGLGSSFIETDLSWSPQKCFCTVIPPPKKSRVRARRLDNAKCNDFFKFLEVETL